MRICLRMHSAHRSGDDDTDPAVFDSEIAIFSTLLSLTLLLSLSLRTEIIKKSEILWEEKGNRARATRVAN
jgi:hypothetical protein